MKQQRETRSIEVRVDGERKLITGVTKHTRCSNVIALLANACMCLKGNDGMALRLIATSYAGERILSPTTKILKVLRSRGSDTTNHSLVLRQTDVPTSPVKRVSRAGRLLKKVKSILTECIDVSADTIGDATLDYTVKDAINYLQEMLTTQSLQQKKDDRKFDILDRYFNDVLAHNLHAGASTTDGYPVAFDDTHTYMCGRGSLEDTNYVLMSSNPDVGHITVDDLDTAFVSDGSDRWTNDSDLDSEVDQFVCMNDELYDPNVAFVSARIPDAAAYFTDPFNDCTVEDIDYITSDEDSAFGGKNIHSDSELIRLNNTMNSAMHRQIVDLDTDSDTGLSSMESELLIKVL